jgi:GTP1/Obg family GTP-binding protein
VQRILALFITTTLATVIFCPITGLSQTRKRTTARSSRSSAKPKASEVQRAGASRVADQIKTLTKFIYVLGGVAKGLESMDDSANRNEASRPILEQAKRNKLIVRTSIQTVREGLDKLELDFRTTPELERYYIKLAGVAAGAANAEDQAAANQFDKAGRTLLEVVNRLTDALLEMR